MTADAVGAPDVPEPVDGEIFVQRMTSRVTRGRRLLGAGAGAVVLGLSAACGTGAPTVPATPAAAGVEHAAAGSAVEDHGGHHAAAGSGAVVELYAVQTGSLGVVVTDGAGHLLYGFDGDETDPPRSHCTGTCADTWLPLVVATGRAPQLLGVDAARIGTLDRGDGTMQLTLAGRPLYTHRDDDGELRAPGDAGGGDWFAFTPAGEKVTV